MSSDSRNELKIVSKIGPNCQDAVKIPQPYGTHSFTLAHGQEGILSQLKGNLVEKQYIIDEVFSHMFGSSK